MFVFSVAAGLFSNSVFGATHYWSFYAEKDSFVEDGLPDQNNGWSQFLNVYYPGPREFFVSGYSFLKFNLTGIPRNATIKSASMRLYLQEGSGDVEVRRVVAPWWEDSLTWRNMPSSASPLGASVHKRFGPGPDSVWIDVTDFVKGWYNNSYYNDGLLLKAYNETSGNFCNCTFLSRQFRGVDYVNRVPQIEVGFETSVIPSPTPTPTIEPTDEIPPSLSLTTTPSGSLFFAPQTVTVTARATDNVGLRSLELAGPGAHPATWTAAGSGVVEHEMSYTVSLDYGVHLFTARVFDQNGLSAQTALTVQVTTKPPLLTISNLIPVTQHGVSLVTNKQSIFKFNYTLDSKVSVNTFFSLKLRQDLWSTSLLVHHVEVIGGVDYIVLSQNVTLEPTVDGRPKTAYLFEFVGSSEVFLPKPLVKDANVTVFLAADPYDFNSWDAASIRLIQGSFHVGYYAPYYLSESPYSTTVKILFLEPDVDGSIRRFTAEEKMELANKLVREPYWNGTASPYEVYLNGLFPCVFTVSRDTEYYASGYSIGWWDADTLGETAADEGYGRVIAIVPDGAISAEEGGHTVGVVYHRFYGYSDQSYHVAYVERSAALDPGRYTYFPIVAHELSHTYRYPDIYDGYKIAVSYDDCVFFNEEKGGIIKIFKETLNATGDLRGTSSYVLAPLPGEAWAYPTYSIGTPVLVSAWDIMDHSGREASDYWSSSSYENVYYYTRRSGDPPESLLVSMLVYSNGTVVGRPFQKLYNQTLSYPSTEGVGDFSLVMYRRSGEVFRSYPFNSSFSCNIEPGGEKIVDAVPFLTAVEWTDDLGKIELVDSSGQVWFSRTVSAHCPTLEIKSPLPLSDLEVGKSHKIVWSSEDEDGDPVWSTVLIKKVESQVWQSLASRVQSSSVDFVAKDYLGPGEYLLQIKVTDGVNTAVQVQQFSIVKEAQRQDSGISGILAIFILAVVCIVFVLIVAILRFRSRKSEA